MKFSEEQEKVLSLKSGWHSCLASAGSGKTEVLTERVCRAISDGVLAEDILCLTFTNRAARSMQERLCEKAQLETTEGAFIGNTHALALEIIKNHKLYPSRFSLMGESLSNELWAIASSKVFENIKSSLPERLKSAKSSDISAYLKEWVEDTPADEYFGVEQLVSEMRAGASRHSMLLISTRVDMALCHDLISVVNHFNSPEKGQYIRSGLRTLYSIVKPLAHEKFDTDFISLSSGRAFEKSESATEFKGLGLDTTLIISIAISIGEEFDRIKSGLYVFDFDDALIKSLSVSPKKFQWCQVDEVQDLSPIQWEILKRSTNPDSHVVLFGDLNQSIYRFLGANIELTKRNLGTSNIELSKNFRSPSNLLEFFNSYMEVNLSSQFSSRISSTKDSYEYALIHVKRETEREQKKVLLSHAEKLAKSGNSTAFLCPSNAEVARVSEILKERRVEHFVVSQNDILESAIAQDFMAFLSVFVKVDDSLSWARLLWLFGRVDSFSSPKVGAVKPSVNALRIVNLLSRNCLRLDDFLGYWGVKNHYLNRFLEAVDEGYVYFDTETTGLSDVEDRVIQIAGVKREGMSSKVEERDLYLLSDKPVGESCKVHNITDDFLLKNALPPNIQIRDFLEFAEGTPLIAHNMPFDERMMRASVRAECTGLLDGFLALGKFCSLDISRRLYPDLPQHKLGFLLDHFSLDGVNSHNAIDDVRAGDSLTRHLALEIRKRIPEAEDVITNNESVLRRFVDNFNPLYSWGEKQKYSNQAVDFDYIFDKYLELMGSSKSVTHNPSLVEAFRIKVSGWASSTLEPDSFSNYVSKFVSHITLMKETDLITEKDNMVVSTIHRSKGLEFDYVIIPNVVEGTFPFYFVDTLPDSNEKTQLLMEQARLLYVAMTRAKKQLVIGTYEKRSHGMAKESRFIFPLLGKMMRH